MSKGCGNNNNSKNVKPEMPRTMRKLLESVTEEELKSIKIAIHRNHIPKPTRLSPLRRTIEDPALLKVHLSGAEGRGVFDRDGIAVNRYDEEVLSPKKLSDRMASDVRDERSSSPTSSTDTTTRKDNAEYKSSEVFKDYIRRRPTLEFPPEERDRRRRYDEYPSTSRDSERSRLHRRDSPRRERSSSPPSDYPRKRSRSLSREHRKTRYRSRSRTPERRRRSSSRNRSRDPQSYDYKPKTERSVTQRVKYEGRRRSPSPRARSRSSERHAKFKPKQRSRTPERRSSSTDRRGERRRHYRSSSRERRRSRSPPLRPGEYRPPRRRSSRSPPLRPGEYRPPKREQEYEEYPRHSGDFMYVESDYTSLIRPQFIPPRFAPPPRGLIRPGHILIPQIQYIPVPHIPPMRPQFIRPPKIYNNRPIPRLVSPPRQATATTSTVTSSSETGNDEPRPKQEDKVND